MHTGDRSDTAVAILNGAIGDHLARTGNALATGLTLLARGRPVALERAALAQALPSAGPRVVVLLHGLMTTEAIWRLADGRDHGALLERDLDLTPLYLRYNSGLAIADSGAALASLLERLVEVYPAPLEELVLLGYSMGGLVARSACHVASLEGHRWLPLVRRAIYVGTPHRGAPLERAGRLVARVLQAVDDPYTRLAAELADLRSDGVKDLGDADLRHQDRARRLASPSLRDPHHPVPLLPSIRHHLVAGALSREPWLASLFGDALVSVASATDGAASGREAAPLPRGQVRVLPGLSHLALASRLEVYEQVRDWCEEELPASTPPSRPTRHAADLPVAAAPAGDPRPPPLPPPGQEASRPAARWRGLAQLAGEAVEHGAGAVERVHLATARRPFTVLERVPGLAGPARLVHRVHDAAVTGAYGLVRLAGRAVGAAAPGRSGAGRPR
ncbi:MAG: alpha/beta hydrolase [Anaeromyxobacter sp.]|nr:alpha/beta hydrolase [Anaeromyxobacter sp.]